LIIDFLFVFVVKEEMDTIGGGGRDGRRRKL